MSRIEFLRNSGYVAIRLFLGAGLAFLLSVVIARLLGPELTGKYAFLVTFSTTLGMIASLGMGPASIFLLGDPNTSKTSLVSTLFLSSVILSGIISILAFALIATVPPLKVGLNQLTDTKNVQVGLVVLFACVLSIYTNLVSTFQGSNQFKLHGLLTLVPAATTLCLTPLVLSQTHELLTPAFIIWGLGYFIALACSLVAALQRTNLFRMISEFNLGISKRLLKFGIVAHLGNISTHLNYRANFYLLGLLGTSKSLGYYAVAIPIAELIWFFSNSVSTVLFPYASSQQGSRSKEINITPLISRWVFLCSSLLATVFFILAEVIVGLAYGKDFLPAAEAIRFLLPGIALWSIVRVLSNDIAGRGRPAVNLAVSIGTLAIAILLNLILIPEFDLVGAALSTSISYVVCTAVVCVIYAKISGTQIHEMIIPQHSDFILLKKLIQRVSGGKSRHS